jgi:hypothetical protein
MARRLDIRVLQKGSKPKCRPFSPSRAVDAKSVASMLRRHGRRTGRSHSPPEAYFRHLGGASGSHDLKSSIDITSELGCLKFLQNFRQDVDEELRFHHILWP